MSVTATDPTLPFKQGVTDADATDGGFTQEETADCKRWHERIKNGRDFDKEARKQYARDRKYARGDDGKFDVSVPIASSNIEVLRSLLFARDPEVACEPSASTEPPPEKELEAKARQDAKTQQDQQTQQAVQAAVPVVHHMAATGQLQGALPQLLPQLQQATQGNPQAIQQQAKDIAAQQAAPYLQKRSDAKQFAQTTELVIQALWKQAKLKSQGLLTVNSALTVGPGWLKGCWQERTGDDPVMRNELNDLQEQLASLNEDQDELAEGESNDPEALKAEIQQKIAGIQSKIEVVVARGFVLDFVAAEDIQCSTDCGRLSDYLNGSYIAHRVFKPMDDAKAMFPRLGDKIDNATLYQPRKPRDANEQSTTGNDVGSLANIEASDADSYVKGDSALSSADKKGNVAIWEVWAKDNGQVLTLVEGVDYYAKDPYSPDPGTTRFYPFFLYAIGNTDGERHPVSLIKRSAKLFDEYNRARSNWKTARGRAIPKMGFNSAVLEPAEAQKIVNASIQELVGIDLKNPDALIGNILMPIAYAQINEALYDTAPIMRELEKIWGVQEALTQGVSVAKTATEAEIQQTGTQSRIGYMRDGVDEVLTDLANYTAEIALQKMSHDDVVRIAGPWALWPEGLKVEDLSTLINVDIKAGSTGKPNSAARQQAWAAIYPMMDAAIDKIGALRGSSPSDIAECHAELIAETLSRTGERVDAERFLPDAPSEQNPPPPSGPPPKPADQALMGPQIIAMTQVCDQVRQGILSGQTAVAVLTASFPTISVTTIEQMVAGVAKLPPALPAAPKTPPIGSGVPTVSAGSTPAQGNGGVPPPVIPPNGTVQ